MYVFKTGGGICSPIHFMRLVPLKQRLVHMAHGFSTPPPLGLTQLLLQYTLQYEEKEVAERSTKFVQQKQGGICVAADEIMRSLAVTGRIATKIMAPDVVSVCG